MIICNTVIISNNFLPLNVILSFKSVYSIPLSEMSLTDMSHATRVIKQIGDQVEKIFPVLMYLQKSSKKKMGGILKKMFTIMFVTHCQMH